MDRREGVGCQPETAPPARPASLRRTVLRALPFVALAIVSVAVLASGAWRHISLQELRERRHDFQAYVTAHPVLAIEIYMAAYAVLVAFSIPGALLMSLTGGYLFGVVPGAAAAVTGASTGATAMFLVARTAFGEALARRFAKSTGLWSRLEAGARRHAFSTLLVLRLMPAVPFALVNLLAGVVRMRLAPYVVATVIGITPSTLIYCWTGQGLHRLFKKSGAIDVSALVQPQVYGPGDRADGSGGGARWPGASSPSPAARLRPGAPEGGRRGARPRLDRTPGAPHGPVSPPAAADHRLRYDRGAVHHRPLAGGLPGGLADRSCGARPNWPRWRWRPRPPETVSDKLTGELLTGAGVISVSVQSGGIRRLLLAAPRTIPVPELVDLRRIDPASRQLAPFRTLTRAEPGPGHMLRVIAPPRFRGGEFIEIVVPERPLKRDLTAYLLRLLATAVFVAGLAGLVVYLSLNAFLVAPMRRITGAMERFRARPEDPAARIVASGRRDEIGRAEAELARMQEDLLAALQSKARLAALGEAVAKINHDLRNMLTRRAHGVRPPGRTLERAGRSRASARRSRGWSARSTAPRGWLRRCWRTVGRKSPRPSRAPSRSGRPPRTRRKTRGLIDAGRAAGAGRHGRPRAPRRPRPAGSHPGQPVPQRPPGRRRRRAQDGPRARDCDPGG